MSDSLTQCRSSNYDWRGEQQTWGPSGKKESSSFWELSVETGTVLDESVSIEEVLLPSFRIWNFLLSTLFNNGIALATIIFSLSGEGFVCWKFCCHELNNRFHVELGGFGDRNEAILLITTVGRFDMLYWLAFTYTWSHLMLCVVVDVLKKMECEYNYVTLWEM